MKAFITGITGQDGSYLAELLLQKGYEVVGMVSNTNDIGQHNITHMKDQLILETGDLLDKESLQRIIQTHQPDEIYNLAGITFIPASWKNPSLTYNVNSLGVLRILEAIRDFSPKSKFFQASSAKMFGDSVEEKQNEETKYNPADPYAVSKLSAHLSVQLFRQHFGIFACNGILFNHESPRRGEEFVFKKITLTAAKIKKGLATKLELGNIEAVVDAGWACDYVQGMWLMLQNKTADDYILATGETHSIREVCEIAFNHLGLNWQEFVTINPEFYRPKQPKEYYGNPNKAETVLNWKRSKSFSEMVVAMVEHDLKNI